MTLYYCLFICRLKAPLSMIILRATQRVLNYLKRKFSPIVSNYPDTSTFLAGDLNNRTSCLPDYITNDNVEFIFEYNDVYFSDDFAVVRNPRDQSENAFGLALIKLCKSYCIHILNGRLHNDKDGNFTCVTYNGASMGVFLPLSIL